MTDKLKPEDFKKALDAWKNMIPLKGRISSEGIFGTNTADDILCFSKLAVWICDHNTTILEALRFCSTPEDNGWMPIDSAPKDGTTIIGFGRNGYALCKWNDEIIEGGVSKYVQQPGWVAVCENKTIPDEGWDEGSGYTLEVFPEYWIPLPLK